MTDTEKIDALRMEVVAYHVDVREHIARFEGWSRAVQTLRADVYGPPGEKGNHPGLVGDVADPMHSRRRFQVGLRGVWALLLLVGGAMLTKLIKW